MFLLLLLQGNKVKRPAYIKRVFVHREHGIGFAFFLPFLLLQSLPMSGIHKLRSEAHFLQGFVPDRQDDGCRCGGDDPG